MTPTRELAAQCHTMLGRLTQFCAGISAALITGGAKNLRAQEAELRTGPCRRASARARACTHSVEIVADTSAHAGPDVVVCTPGRMVDHLTNSAGTHLDNLETLVLDEADRLLEMGFTEEARAARRPRPRAPPTARASHTSPEPPRLNPRGRGRARRWTKSFVRAPAAGRRSYSRRRSTPESRSS